MRLSLSIRPSTIRHGCTLLLPLMLSGCFLAKDKITDIPNAENILITSDQKLIVSGGKNIYQIEKDGPGYQAKELFDGLNKFSFWNVPKYGCQFTGIAQHQNYLFATCVSQHFVVFKNNHLLYADLNDAELTFRMITDFDNNHEVYDQLFIPNGMAIAPDGALLVADENFFAESGIARVELDYSGSKPEIVSVQPNWVSPLDFDIRSPNGIRVQDNFFYFSDENKVKRGRFDDAGQVQDVITMWTSKLAYPLSLLDDIMPYCGGVAMTDFLTGQLHYVASYTDQNNVEHFPTLYSTLPFSYANPSSLAYGAIPQLGINTAQILVTEKGNLLESTSNYGNKLVVSPLSLDLDNPNIDMCEVLNDQAREAIEGS